MNEGLDGTLITIQEGVKEKLEGIPIFELPSINQMDVHKLATSILECSRSIDAVKSLSSELSLISHDIRNLKRIIVTGSDEELVIEAESYLKSVGISLIERHGALSSHLTTLRSLLSAVQKHGGSLGNVSLTED